jgi:hypothetical protein
MASGGWGNRHNTPAGFKSTLGNIAYWRLINTNGGLIARILGGAVGQTALSEEEGFTVDTKGPFGTGQFEDHEGAAFHEHSGTGETPMLLSLGLRHPVARHVAEPLYHSRPGCIPDLRQRRRSKA